jgi:immune inhibitor A
MNNQSIVSGCTNGWISESSDGSRDSRCLIPPSPELRERMKQEMETLRGSTTGFMANMLRVREVRPPGMNDGLIYPGDSFPLGTPVRMVRDVALERTPLRGALRVIVVLVQFSDMALTHSQAQFEELFFSTGVLPNGSVREYYQEVTHNLVDITGEVVGPFTLPRTLMEYAHGASGTGAIEPNARTMAKDAALAADASVNFSHYDNDGDGFVDAFIVVHAGAGAESTGNVNDIWSHKWVFPASPYLTDGTKVYAYLTVPEDSKIGVCCHELGHLLFGFPDLYDIDYSSEGVGNWCLMSGGSWNGAGEIPAHPSAWCKKNQEWVSVTNIMENATMPIQDVKTSQMVYRLWREGSESGEYFLIENRQKSLYDRMLPGDGLLIWHIDDSISTNSDENHPKVALVQADGKQDLENGNNRGDAGDPYPGSANNRSFTATTLPNSNSYAHVDTCVSVTNIGASAPVISAKFSVTCQSAQGGGVGQAISDFWSWLKNLFKK